MLSGQAGFLLSDTTNRHDGAVGKYMGEAVMALLGVPVPHADHPRRAVAAAIDVRATLIQLQVWWRDRGLPVLQARIRVNTGTMTVGNTGSARHTEFTVIGDTANAASLLRTQRSLGYG